MESGLTFPIEKNAQVAEEETIALIKQWVTSLDKKLYSSLINKTIAVEETWKDVLQKYFNGKRAPESMPDDSNINTQMDRTNNAQFVEDVSKVITGALGSKDNLEKMIFNQEHPKVELKDNKIVTTEETTHLLGNIIMSLMFTLSLHEYQYDRILSIGKALYRGAKTTLGQVEGLERSERVKAVEALTELRIDIHDALKEINDAD